MRTTKTRIYISITFSCGVPEKVKDLSGLDLLKVIFLYFLFITITITWHMLRYIITITTMYLSSYSRLMMGDCLPGPAVLVKYSSWPVGTVF